MSLALAGGVMVLFSIMGFVKPNPLPFMLAAGASLILGLSWYNAYTDNLGLGISLTLIAWSFVCVGYAFKCIFQKNKTEGVE